MTRSPSSSCLAVLRVVTARIVRYKNGRSRRMSWADVDSWTTMNGKFGHISSRKMAKSKFASCSSKSDSMLLGKADDRFVGPVPTPRLPNWNAKTCWDFGGCSCMLDLPSETSEVEIDILREVTGCLSGLLDPTARVNNGVFPMVSASRLVFLRRVTSPSNFSSSFSTRLFDTRLGSCKPVCSKY